MIERRRRYNRIRRVRELRRNCILLMLSIYFFVTIIGACIFSIRSRACEETEEVCYKYYTTKEISYGDTLWSIAEEYFDSDYYANLNDYIRELCRINNLDGEDIFAGTELVIPYYSTDYLDG